MARIRDEILALVHNEDVETAASGTPELQETATAAVAVEDGPALPSGASGADVPSWVRAILRCPDCGGELRDVHQAMQCTACARVHPVEGGIPVLIAGRHDAPSEG